jgi:hypothetical protein
VFFIFTRNFLDNLSSQKKGSKITPKIAQWLSGISTQSMMREVPFWKDKK